jgi:uncharacterized protein CbrC (UPF0167 family)
MRKQGRHNSQFWIVNIRVCLSYFLQQIDRNEEKKILEQPEKITEAFTNFSWCTIQYSMVVLGLKEAIRSCKIGLYECVRIRKLQQNHLNKLQRHADQIVQVMQVCNQ